MLFFVYKISITLVTVESSLDVVFIKVVKIIVPVSSKIAVSISIKIIEISVPVSIEIVVSVSIKTAEIVISVSIEVVKIVSPVIVLSITSVVVSSIIVSILVGTTGVATLSSWWSWGESIVAVKMLSLK